MNIQQFVSLGLSLAAVAAAHLPTASAQDAKPVRIGVAGASGDITNRDCLTAALNASGAFKFEVFDIGLSDATDLTAERKFDIVTVPTRTVQIPYGELSGFGKPILSAISQETTKIYSRNSSISDLSGLYGKEINLIGQSDYRIGGVDFILPVEAFPEGDKRFKYSVNKDIAQFLSDGNAEIIASNESIDQATGYREIWRSPNKAAFPAFSRSNLDPAISAAFQTSWLKAVNLYPNCFSGYSLGDSTEWRSVADTSAAQPYDWMSTYKLNPSHLVTASGSDDTVAVDMLPSSTSGMAYPRATFIQDLNLRKFVSVDVFFATNRMRGDFKDDNSIYLDRNSQNFDVDFGRMTVTIPRDYHDFGEVENIDWRRWLPSIIRPSGDVNKDISVFDVETMNEEEFYVQIEKQKPSAVSQNEVLIYIPGYNNSFRDGALRAAQLSHDLSVQGATILYSWPSQNSVERYAVDETMAENSVIGLISVINMLENLETVGKIHLVAHSMGSRVLLNALKELRSDGLAPKKVNEIILAAPDITAQLFKTLIYPRIRSAERYFTIYASGTDKALWASNGFNGLPALGGLAGTEVELENVEVIDVSGLPCGFLCHSLYTSDGVMRDLFTLVRHGARASKRALLEKKPPFLWRFAAGQ